MSPFFFIARQVRAIRRRWKTHLLQGAFLATAFAAGWYASVWTVKYNSSATNNQSVSVKNPAAELAKAKADLARILHQSAGNDRERDLFSFANSLDARTLSGILADLAHSGMGLYNVSNQNEKALCVLLARLVELSPIAAMNSLKNFHDPDVRRDLTEKTFDAWSAKNPVAALAAISQLPANDLRYMLREKVLDNMVDQDPQSAFLALRNQPAEQRSVYVYQNMFGEWANNDPSSAAAAALNLPPSLARSKALEGVASAWAAQDPASALAWANALPISQVNADAINTIIETMSQQDPASAANYALQLPGGTDHDQLIIDIVGNWAQSDPTGALTWANTNLTGETFDYAASVALYHMGETDPVGAAAALAKISDPNVINKAVPQLAVDLAAQDVQAAMQWAQSLPTDNVAMRNSALSSVLHIWTIEAPEDAATYVQQNFASDPSFGTIASQVVTFWANDDPQAALNWAENLSSGNAQNSAVITALTKMATLDPQSAAAAAAQNPVTKLTGLTRDQQTTLQNIAAKGAAP